MRRSRAAVGGSLAASREALQEGISGQLAGGTHHAHRDFGSGYCVFNDAAVAASRIPAGHPEGFLEGFGNLYRDIAEVLISKRAEPGNTPVVTLVPGITDGLRGMQFVDRAVASSAAGACWMDLVAD